jgi:hypothetical protein
MFLQSEASPMAAEWTYTGFTLSSRRCAHQKQSEFARLTKKMVGAGRLNTELHWC